MTNELNRVHQAEACDKDEEYTKALDERGQIL